MNSRTYLIPNIVLLFVCSSCVDNKIETRRDVTDLRGTTKQPRDINYIESYKRPKEKLDSIIIPDHLNIGQFLNQNRIIHGYYLNSDLVLYREPDSSSPIVFRDSTYKWSGFSELSGDGYLVTSDWNIVEYSKNWVKISYHNATGWLPGQYFAATKIRMLDNEGNFIKEFLSPFRIQGISTLIPGEDTLICYVSNYKDFYVKVDLHDGRVLDTVRSYYLIERGLLQRSYIHTYLNVSEEDFALLQKMNFDPRTFKGRFLTDKVLYIPNSHEFLNCLVSMDYETELIDTLFHFNRLQHAVAYQIGSLYQTQSGDIVMSMNAYNAKY